LINAAAVARGVWFKDRQSDVSTVPSRERMKQ